MLMKKTAVVALPKVAYVLVWFPKPSETFIFREVSELYAQGLRVEVLTLYGPLRKHLSDAMRAYNGPVRRAGLRALPGLPLDILYWLKRRPGVVTWAFSSVLFRRWRTLETAGEAFLAILFAFRFARQCVEQGVEHIHADWATGATTAAWVASRLTCLPFSFTGRSADIFPPDGALSEKMADCAFMRTDVGSNVPYLLRTTGTSPEKIKLIYASMTMRPQSQATLRLEPPFRLLAIGRFVEKKGFDVLLRACALLKEQGLAFQLALVGSGPLETELKNLANELRVTDVVSFPGFVAHDAVPGLLCDTDVFVMPSQVAQDGDRDGIPNVIMEAMAHGVPVVATDVSGLGEVVLNKRTGVLVPQKDPQALAQGILSLCKAPATAREQAANGKDFVMRVFAPETCARRLIAQFTAAAKGWKQPEVD